MDNRTVLDIGLIIADFHQGAVSKFSILRQENQVNQDLKETQTAEYENTEPLGDYGVTYEEICNLLENAKQKWGSDIEQNIFNCQYQRDLLYLYDRITLDMNYLKGYPDRNNAWLEKLMELKYEIRNLF